MALAQTWRVQAPVMAPIAFAVFLSWVLIATSALNLTSPALCVSTQFWDFPSTEKYLYFFAWVSPIDLAISWTLMVIAMMLPTLSGAITQIHLSSCTHLKVRAILLSISGYLACWILAGVALFGAALSLRLMLLGNQLPFLLSVALAVFWHLTPWKQMALNKCHSRPTISAFTPTIWRDSLQIGFSRGLACIINCWALMLLALLVPTHHFLVMIIIAVWLWAERAEPPRLPYYGLRPLPRKAFRFVLYYASHLKKSI